MKKKFNTNIDYAVIYAVADINDKIVYIGKTKNFKKRIDTYLYPNSCHNLALREWLKNNQWHFLILEHKPEDLNKSEKTFIKNNFNTLFNMVHGGDQNWRHHDRKPWMARIGVHCPSDILLRFLANRNYELYKKAKEIITPIRKNMSTKERVVFETGLAMDNDLGNFSQHITKWLSFTKDRLLKILENE